MICFEDPLVKLRRFTKGKSRSEARRAFKPRGDMPLNEGGQGIYCVQGWFSYKRGPKPKGKGYSSFYSLAVALGPAPVLG